MKSKTTVIEVLAAIIAQDYDLGDLFRRSRAANVPIEYFYVMRSWPGARPSRTFESATELEDAINRVRDGWIPVQCHVTLGKRAAHGFARWIERNAASLHGARFRRGGLARREPRFRLVASRARFF